MLISLWVNNTHTHMDRTHSLTHFNYINTATTTWSIGYLYNYYVPCADWRSLWPCRSETLYGCKINRQTSCDLIPPSIPPGSFNPGRNLTEGGWMAHPAGGWLAGLVG